MPLRWKSDLDKKVLVDNFNKRGWEEAEGDDWDIYWATVGNIKNLLNPEFGYRLTAQQRLNHFPNHYELTRKDLMVKNVKRHKKEMAKQNITIDFLPATFCLPTDYALFVEVRAS